MAAMKIKLTKIMRIIIIDIVRGLFYENELTHKFTSRISLNNLRYVTDQTRMSQNVFEKSYQTKKRGGGAVNHDSDLQSTVSWKYWQSLNLAVLPQTVFLTLLVDLNLVVWYGNMYMHTEKKVGEF